MRLSADTANARFVRRPFASPLRLATGTIADITEATAEATVRVDGIEATGFGAIYLSDLWAWPDANLPSEVRDAAMRAYLEAACAELPALCEGAEHPLEFSARLHARCLADTRSPLPPLARLVATSPLDAAVHDAAGRARGVSAFLLATESADCPTADPCFGSRGAVAAVANLLRFPPASTIDASVVVGKGDSLESVDPWVADRGIHTLKLKIGGTDPGEDAARCIAVHDHAMAIGCRVPRLSVDANCATPDAATVARFLDELGGSRPDVLQSIDSIEQPTNRDIQSHPFAWGDIARRVPLLLDEGWIDWSGLQEAERQGWNGLAVKTCKGHGFALLAAAWAHERGWHLRMMDLTNPGIAAIQSLAFAAHLPGVPWIECNAIQYTPTAHAQLPTQFRSALDPRGGLHAVPTNLVGLGSKA